MRPGNLDKPIPRILAVAITLAVLAVAGYVAYLVIGWAFQWLEEAKRAGVL